jgi:hypothetical protein
MADLSPSERVFAMRMLPHIEAGKSFEDAARAVLDDDVRLFSAFLDRGETYYRPNPDDLDSRLFCDRSRPGDVIAREIAAATYRRIRGERA